MAGKIPSSKEFFGALNQLCQDADMLRGELSESDRLSSLKLAQKLARSLEKPRDAILKMSFSPGQIVVVRIAVDMGIFQALTERDTPLTLDELAAVKNADPILTERVLRLLCAIGYVIENDVRVYSANDITREMSTRLGSATIRLMFDSISITLAKLPEWIRQMKFQNPPGTSNGPFQYVENTKGGIWEYLFTRPELNDDFNTFMEASSADRPYWVNWFPVQEQLLDEYIGGAEDALLVDIAGGKGHDIKRFHAKFPGTPGRLFLEDQDHVLAEAEVGDNIEKIHFDLFQPQPIKGAKIYYMHMILHDWSDSECQEILHNIRNAMTKGYSKLIIQEFVMPERDAPFLASIWDWQMLAFCNSMERNEKHWGRLLTSCGFKVVQFWPPPGDGHYIIEAEMI
ncbi:hypothetical protein N7456_005253 [Penicillium angulare]|uniref:O-methyltransferase domain-containing protein n=1 Tax=Penicillium angulare TaxID=116970 RepID=A0A9W9FY28_9EURO|nr:hypothetical protein N7456_005253 [Penicillium angulare]